MRVVVEEADVLYLFDWALDAEEFFPCMVRLLFPPFARFLVGRTDPGLYS